MLLLSALYLLTGALTGLMAGLFGIGGGLVIVPFLLVLLSLGGFPADHVVHTVVGSSLAIIVFTASASAWQHYRQASVLWSDSAWLAPGLVVGSMLGAWVADRLDGQTLTAGIGIFSMLTALQMSLNVQPNAVRQIQRWTLVPVGGAIGTASTLCGIGGGSLTVPFLHWMGRDMHQSVGTSALCALPVAITGAVAFAFTGLDAEMPPWSTGYLYWPAVLGVSLTSVPAARIGARIARRLSAAHLRRAFVIYLLLVGLFLMGRSAGLGV